MTEELAQVSEPKLKVSDVHGHHEILRMRRPRPLTLQNLPANDSAKTTSSRRRIDSPIRERNR